MKEKNLKTITGNLTPENWPQEINRMACDSALDALKNLDTQAAVELAFATLQAYFTLVYANSCPLFEESAAAKISQQTLTKILSSCGLSFDSIITNIEPPGHV